MIQDAPFQPVPVRGSAFTPVRVGGGASDAIGRMGNLVDVMGHYLPDLEFLLPEYRNYHCPGIDFLALFGIAEGRRSVTEVDFAQTVDVTLSELVAALVAGQFQATDNTLYQVRPDIYHGRKRSHVGLATLIQRDGLKLGFLDRLRYAPGPTPFSDHPDTVRAVIHLRRRDICGHLLFDAARPNPIPKLKIVSKPLLEISEAVAQLENHLPGGTQVELVIASDGTDWLRQTYRNHAWVLERIDGIEADLHKDPVSDLLNITLRGRIFGGSPEVTLQTLDAMYHADIVVTQSSSFARLPCGVSGGTILRNDGPDQSAPALVQAAPSGSRLTVN